MRSQAKVDFPLATVLPSPMVSTIIKGKNMTPNPVYNVHPDAPQGPQRPSVVSSGGNLHPGSPNATLGNLIDTLTILDSVAADYIYCQLAPLLFGLPSSILPREDRLGSDRE